MKCSIYLIVLFLISSPAFADNLANQELLAAQNAAAIVQNQANEITPFVSTTNSHINTIDMMANSNTIASDSMSNAHEEVNLTTLSADQDQREMKNELSNKTTPLFVTSNNHSINLAINHNQELSLMSITHNTELMDSPQHSPTMVPTHAAITDSNFLAMKEQTEINEAEFAANYCKHEDKICLEEFTRHYHKK